MECDGCVCSGGEVEWSVMGVCGVGVVVGWGVFGVCGWVKGAKPLETSGFTYTNTHFPCVKLLCCSESPEQKTPYIGIFVIFN